MSKAMDALEYIKQRIAWCPEHEKCPSCRDTESNLALLRDYITTTEAELENSRDVIEEFGAHVEIGSIGHYSAQDAIEGINKAIGPDKKTARIKELEEALKPFSDEADRRPFLGVDACRANIAGNIGGSALTNLDLINARAALDGARKVEP